MQKTSFYLALITSQLVPEIQAQANITSVNSTTNYTQVYVPPFPITNPLWLYGYNFGGNEWPNSANSCGGRSQSPINLDAANPQSAPKNTFFQLYLINQSSESRFSIDTTVNCKGYFSDLVANDTNGVSLLYRGVGFQIHAPSEHFYNGRLYDAEVQLIHQIDANYANLTAVSYAIVSVFYSAADGASSSLFDSIKLDNIQKMTNYNLFQAFQNDYVQQSSYFMYTGSMTFPPCNETVNWFVMANPTPMGLSQLARLDTLYRVNKAFANGRGNNRYLQNINGRTVYQNSFINNMAVDMSTSPYFSPILQAVGPVLAQS